MSLFYDPILGYMPLIIMSAFILMLCGAGLYGWYKSKKGDEDFYLAGRGQGLLVTVLTIMATFFSSSAMLAIPGNVYKDGAGFMIFALNLPIAGVAVYLLGSRIWKIGRAKGYLTQGDMISDYYDKSTFIRFLVAMLGFFYILPYIVMQIRAGGLMAEILFANANGQTIFGGLITLDMYLFGATALTLVLVLYILVGGMRSVALADAIQGSLLLFGMLVAGYMIVATLGGPGNFLKSVSELDPKALSLPGYTDRYTILALWTICVFGAVASMVQPAQWMRYYSAQSAQTLKRSMIIFATVLPICFLFGVMLVGLGARVLYPPTIVTYSQEQLSQIQQVQSGKIAISETTISQQMLNDYNRGDSVSSDANKRFIPHATVSRSDQALIAVLRENATSVFGGLGAFAAAMILVGILAASMSTADANLHALSAVLTHDVYTKLVRPTANERERVWCNRAVILFAAAFSLFLVMVGERNKDFAPLKMIIELQFVAMAFACQLVPVTIDMLYIRRGTKAGAIAGMVAGLIVVFGFTPVPTLLLDGMQLPDAANGFSYVVALVKSFFDLGFCGLVPNVIVFILVSMITRSHNEQTKKDFESILAQKE
ncbi:MAG: sodium:solute symporter family protein [Planctomycetia bacterium]|nr:sodium:solute symporter family protein [Planctomycetia bacterium]